VQAAELNWPGNCLTDVRRIARRSSYLRPGNSLKEIRRITTGDGIVEKRFQS
jgi:hypothetical protein